jgi:ketosteroid isomerase-like protein
MSQENTELVWAFFAASDHMDKQSLLASLPAIIEQTCDPEIEWVEDPQRADGRTYRGHAGVRESFERWLEQWDEYGFEVDEIVDCGDRVLVKARESARGAASGAAVSARIYTVMTFRAGKVLRYQEFYDEAQALEAAGSPA